MPVTSLLTGWLTYVADDLVTVLVTWGLVVVAAVIYWRGVRYEARTGIGRPIAAAQSLAFEAGLFTFAFAVASPLDTLADTSLPWHMLQHGLLIFIAAPLLLFGAPLWPLWRALPTRWRRASLRWLLTRRWARGAWFRIEAVLRHPIGAWLVFIVPFLLWHIPLLYDYALKHVVVHALEHVTFLATALVFWAQVIPSFPLVPRLSYVVRAGYILAAGLVLHLLAVLISIAAHPIYTYYGSSAEVVAQQSAAGALMDVSGQVVFTIGILICLWMWLRDDEEVTQRATEGILLEATPSARASGAMLLAEADLATPDTAHGKAEW